MMTKIFKDFTKGEDDPYSNKEACKRIKNFSCKQIENEIKNSKELQEKIFNGRDLYEKPYTAWFFYHGETIEPLTTIPFSI